MVFPARSLLIAPRWPEGRALWACGRSRVRNWKPAKILIDIEAELWQNYLRAIAPGDVAQLGERCLRKAEAEGSNPFISTRK